MDVSQSLLQVGDKRVNAISELYPLTKAELIIGKRSSKSVADDGNGDSSTIKVHISSQSFISQSILP